MERGERNGEGGAEKAENLWEKLRRAGKSGGHSTPAASFWRSNELGSQQLHDGRISSRKLAAALWELHHYKLPLAQKIPPCNPSTPPSSIESRRRNYELGHSSRTSTQLLKVLNRIWGLEEQNESNFSPMEALKKELGHAREKQGGQFELDKLLRKNKEKGRVVGALHSIMREKVESERKCSERLQRDLANELCEVKASLASLSKELNDERRSRWLLEDLCDELACGVICCEKELHDMRKKCDKQMSVGGDQNHLILRISQVWLDRRMQRNPSLQNSSVERIKLNLGNDDDGSLSSDSDCFESVYTVNKKGLNEKVESCDRTRLLSPLRLQAKFEGHANTFLKHHTNYSLCRREQSYFIQEQRLKSHRWQSMNDLVFPASS